MCCSNFWVGMVMGVAAGTCIGMRAKANERKIRRFVNRTVRDMENAFDSMSR